MTKYNKVRATITLACVLGMASVASFGWSTSFGRSEIRKTWAAASGERLQYSDITLNNKGFGDLISESAVFLFGVALCGIAAGILCAIAIPRTQVGPLFFDSEEDRKSEFAAAVATALPTIAVRIDPTVENPEHPVTLVENSEITRPWASA
jgi:hypothetical protein